MPESPPSPTDHLDELKVLVDYQARQGSVVTFQLRVSTEDARQVGIYVLRVSGQVRPTDWPLVLVDTIEPMVVWLRASFVRVNTSQLTPFAVTFRLTRQGILSAQRAHQGVAD